MARPGASVNDAAFRTRTKRWLAHTSEFVAPLLRTGAALASRGTPSEPAAWRNGLILSHNHIGDVMYRTCSLEQLRRGLPECEWSFLTSPGSADLLEGNPHLREVLPWNTGDNSWQLDAGAFAKLREREFDVVLCTNTLRHYPDLALAIGLGIPNRVAFGDRGLSGLITRVAVLRFPSAYAEYFRDMVAGITDQPAEWPLHPRVYPGEAEVRVAGATWTSLGLGERPVVACCVTTRQASGNWPRSYLLGALEEARAQVELDVVLCGAASDSAALIAAANELSFTARVLAGGLGLRAFCAFLQRCSALLTLDSGPRHLGNATGIPVLFARNLSHSQVEAGKYCATEIDLAPAVEYLSDQDARQVGGGVPVTETARKLIKVLAAEHQPASETLSGTPTSPSSAAAQ